MPQMPWPSPCLLLLFVVPSCDSFLVTCDLLLLIRFVGFASRSGRRAILRCAELFQERQGNDPPHDGRRAEPGDGDRAGPLCWPSIMPKSTDRGMLCWKVVPAPDMTRTKLGGHLHEMMRAEGGEIFDPLEYEEVYGSAVC